jgi:hypothetical protein
VTLTVRPETDSSPEVCGMGRRMRLMPTTVPTTMAITTKTTTDNEMRRASMALGRWCFSRVADGAVVIALGQ